MRGKRFKIACIAGWIYRGVSPSGKIKRICTRCITRAFTCKATRRSSEFLRLAVPFIGNFSNWIWLDKRSEFMKTWSINASNTPIFLACETQMKIKKTIRRYKLYLEKYSKIEFYLWHRFVNIKYSSFSWIWKNKSRSRRTENQNPGQIVKLFCFSTWYKQRCEIALAYQKHSHFHYARIICSHGNNALASRVSRVHNMSATRATFCGGTKPSRDLLRDANVYWHYVVENCATRLV